MRTLFWILLIVNVMLFAVMQRGGFEWGEQPYQPQPPLNEKKIRLLDPNQAAEASAQTVSAPAATATAAEVPAQVTASAPAADSVPPDDAVPPASPPPDLDASEVPVANTVPVAGKRDKLICLEWGDFSGADLTRAAGVLGTLKLGDKLGQRQIAYEKGYWVYIPPLKTITAANKKVSQIRKLGIKEYFIVREGEAMRYAISLGVFKTQEAARTYLNELKAKGLRSAKVGERASKLKTTVFALNNVDDSIEAKLAVSRRDFPGSELRNVPCALTR